jgi:type VI secretion system secreted protein VgrG
MDRPPFSASSELISALGADAQTRRLLTLTFPRGDGPPDTVMLANMLHAREELSRDFCFHVEVLSDDARIALNDVMAKMVTIALAREDGSLRYFNGYVTEFRFIKTDGGFAYYGMRLEPWLAYAKLRTDSVSNHQRSVIELTEATFRHYPQRDWGHRLYDADPRLTCANQYNETDHNHLHRRWEALGLHTWYEHRADGHTLWIGDNTCMAAPIDAGVDLDHPQQIPFRSEAGAQEDDSIHRWQAVRRAGASLTTLASFDYKNPRAQTVDRPSLNEHGMALELYADTGAYGYRDSQDGATLAQRRMEEHDARGQYFLAEGNDRCAQAGRWFELAGHFGAAPNAGGDGEYLILSVEHNASNNYHTGTGAISHYSNKLTCQRKSVAWRPGIGYNSKPVLVPGVLTAIVTGPKGEEIHTDSLGRITLQFHWDRLGQYDENSSPWIRCVTPQAGAGFGQIGIPRVGQEVAVQFLDGNPDHPIVIGCVYNALHMPPWELPDNKSQSGVLTRSTLGGMPNHANAVRFEDEKGKEQLWLHAEKDQLTEVEHDEDKWVGNDRRKTVDRDETTLVKHDRTETVGNDEVITVHHDRRERVDGDEKISIGSDRNEHVEKNETVRIDGNRGELVMLAKEEVVLLAKILAVGLDYAVTVGAGMQTNIAKSQTTEVGADRVTDVRNNYHIETGDSFSITVGAATLRMTSDGAIALSGTQIDIAASGPVRINGKNVDVN